MYRLITIVTLILTCIAPYANAKKDKNSGKIIMAKVWFKDGSVYEGPLVKHWSTYAQKFTASGHNFHTLPDPNGKSVKREAYHTDSILIISSTHRDFPDSTMYVSMTNGRVPMNGPKKKTNKMLRRVNQGRYVDFCTLPYMGNCMRGLKNDDQLLKYWLIRFHDNGEAVVFFSVPIWKGCNKEVNYLTYFYEHIKTSRPGLAEAIKDKYFSDKKTNKKGEAIGTAQEFADFIDDYLAKHLE